MTIEENLLGRQEFKKTIPERITKQEVIKCVNWSLDQYRKVNKKYDNIHDYKLHIDFNMKNAFEFKHLLPLISPEITFEEIIVSNSTHDLQEDTHLTYNDIKQFLFKNIQSEISASNILEITYALTEYRGRTRDERHPPEYYAGIRNQPGGRFGKMCDTLANVEFGKTFRELNIYFEGNEGMIKTYRKDYPKFRSELYIDVLDPMFVKLEKLLEI